MFGIDRKIAYAHRKYHSGLIWTGVTKGFAGRKFSGSASILGTNSAMTARRANRTIKPTRSFVV